MRRKQAQKEINLSSQGSKDERSTSTGDTNEDVMEEKDPYKDFEYNLVKKKPKKTVKKVPEQKVVKLCRTCLSGLKYFLMMLFVPPFLNYASLHQETRTLQPEAGLLYDIGFGQKMFMNCMGKGAPTVILDAPTGMTSDVWTAVQPELAKSTRVCVYDRAGLGFSDRPHKNFSLLNPFVDDDFEKEGVSPPPPPQMNKWHEYTVERMADDLHNLLTKSSQQEKPFIMVGSEMGASVARFYAQLNEKDVSDLVLVDPLVENLFDQDDDIWNQFWFGQLIPSFQSMQLAAAVGLTRLALIVGLMDVPISGHYVSNNVTLRQKHFLCHPKHLSSVVDEHHFINDTFSQLRTLFQMKQFPTNVGVTVINGNYYDDQLPSSLNKAWAKSQQHLISNLHPGSNHIVVNGADHRMLYKNPFAVIDPVNKLVRRWRSKNKKRKTTETTNGQPTM